MNRKELAQIISETVEDRRANVEAEVYTQAVLYADGMSARMLANPENAAAEAETSFRVWMDAYPVSELELVDRTGRITVSTDGGNAGIDLHSQLELERFLELLDEEDYAASYVDGAVLHNASIVVGAL